VATNERRKQRYATDETYRERKVRASRDKREAEKQAKLAAEKLHGWKPIHSVPSEYVVQLHDPNIWGPVLAYLTSGGHWRCLHYSGPDPRPTHWRYMPRPPEI
jgi:hypothetical protein